MPLFFVLGAIIGRDFHVSTVFKQIEPSFRRSTSGKIDRYGLVKFPKTGW